MKKKTNIVTNNKSSVILILFVCILFFLSNDMGIFRWYELRKERNQTQKEIDELIVKHGELSEEIYRLINNKEYIKKIAQEKFHMVKKGEKIFRVIDKKIISN